MYKQDLKNLRIVVENILESNLGKQFLCENEIYQNFSMDKYLKLNQRSSRFGRTLKRKRYDDMVYSEKQLQTIEDDDKDDTYDKVGKFVIIIVIVMNFPGFSFRISRRGR